MRRRRRRGNSLRGPALGPRTAVILAGGAAVAVIASFFYLLNVADNADPQRAEKRIELPDAFKN
ncbi:MAG: hypothetical protein NW200_09145 [Hyphomonadaceae bacterium]|nr:hypothetical protein [Hyphomonadaceae bacterium]